MTRFWLQACVTWRTTSHHCLAVWIIVVITPSRSGRLPPHWIKYTRQWRHRERDTWHVKYLLSKSSLAYLLTYYLTVVSITVATLRERFKSVERALGHETGSGVRSPDDGKLSSVARNVTSCWPIMKVSLYRVNGNGRPYFDFRRQCAQKTAAMFVFKRHPFARRVSRPIIGH